MANNKEMNRTKPITPDVAINLDVRMLILNFHIWWIFSRNISIQGD
jgi:hypothetical protein